MESTTQLRFEDVLLFNRNYVNGLGEAAPYDLNGVTHLALAALDNLREHWIEGDGEQILESASQEQKDFLIDLGKFLEKGVKQVDSPSTQIAMQQRPIPPRGRRPASWSPPTIWNVEKKRAP